MCFFVVDFLVYFFLTIYTFFHSTCVNNNKMCLALLPVGACAYIHNVYKERLNAYICEMSQSTMGWSNYYCCLFFTDKLL